MKLLPVPFRKFFCSFRKFKLQSPLYMIRLQCSQHRNGKGGEHMAKERFVEVYSQGLVNVAKIIVDTETGVNYLLGSHNKQTGTGMTVLVNQDGKPVVTPIK